MNIRKKPRVVKSWDALPPVMYDGEEALSTRYLERKYRLMDEALRKVLSDSHIGVVPRSHLDTIKEILDL